MHELIDAVAATPAGPVVILAGKTLDISAAIMLNGPPPGNPTSSTYTMTWQRVGLGATLASQSPADPLTVYTKTIGAEFLPLGTHQFKVEGYVIYDPFYEQYVTSNLITVHVVPYVREAEAELPDREAVAGLPSREGDAALPDREAVAGLPERETDATLPSREGTAGIP